MAHLFFPPAPTFDGMLEVVRATLHILGQQRLTPEQALFVASRYWLPDALEAWLLENPNSWLDLEDFLGRIRLAGCQNRAPAKPCVPDEDMPRPQLRGKGNPRGYSNHRTINRVIAAALEVTTRHGGFMHLSARLAEDTGVAAGGVVVILCNYTTMEELLYLHAMHPPRYTALQGQPVWERVIWPGALLALAENPDIGSLKTLLEVVGDMTGAPLNRVRIQFRSFATDDQREALRRYFDVPPMQVPQPRQRAA